MQKEKGNRLLEGENPSFKFFFSKGREGGRKQKGFPLTQGKKS